MGLSKQNWIWIGGLMLVQLILGLLAIDTFPIALDEPFTLYHSQKDLSDMVVIFENENNPPLHFLLLHFWIKLFGLSAVSVRSLSLIFSMLTIPVLYALGKKITNHWGAVLLIGCFIFSSFHHYHAVEARVYSLFVLLFSLIFLELYLILFEQSRKAIIRLAIWNAALLYSHYLGGFIVGCEALVILCFVRRLEKKQWYYIIGAVVLMVVLFIPGIRLMLIRYGAFSDNGTWVPPAQFSELYGNILRFFNGKYSFLGVLLILGGFVVAYRKRIFQTKWFQQFLEPKLVFVFLMFLIPYLGMFVVSKLFQPIFLDRYLLYTSIPLFLVFVVVVWLIVERKNTMLLLIPVVPLLVLFKLFPDNDREPDQVAGWIHENTESDKTVLICPPFYDLTFMYHYAPEMFSNYKETNNLREGEGIFTLYSGEELQNIPLSNQVVFVDSDADFLFPENGIREQLELNYRLTESKPFKGGLVLYVYSK